MIKPDRRVWYTEHGPRSLLLDGQLEPFRWGDGDRGNPEQSDLGGRGSLHASARLALWFATGPVRLRSCSGMCGKNAAENSAPQLDKWPTEIMITTREEWIWIWPAAAAIRKSDLRPCDRCGSEWFLVVEDTDGLGAGLACPQCMPAPATAAKVIGTLNVLKRVFRPATDQPTRDAA